MKRSRQVGSVAVMAEQCSARSPRGLALAAAPTAAHVGATILATGGNAYDAAVAAALAETVLLPPKCGLAGDLVALAWRRDDPRPEALIAIGGAPRALADVAGRGELTDTGPSAVGVPGAPAGYAALAGRGRLGIERLARPAIELAEQGFCWSRICTVLTEESLELLRSHNREHTVFTPGGEPIEPGAVIRLPGLARALEMFAADPPSFLTGPVGQAMVARVHDAGGVLTVDDMSHSRADWVDPVSLTSSAGIVFATPAPTHGPSLLTALGALPEVGGSAAEVYGAVMAAIAQRREMLADPSGTSMVSAADRDGTLVTIVHSNSYPRYGSGLVVGEFDLILANRAGRGFSSDPGHPNFPRPGARPATTLHAWGLSTPDGRRALGATPGGANQMPWNAQALVRLRRDPDVARAIVEPRWEWLPADDGVRVEDGLDTEESRQLESVAPRCETTGRWGLRSAMQIVVDDRRGSYLGVVDPRTVGAVIPI